MSVFFQSHIFSHIFTPIMHQPLTGTSLYFHLESVLHPFHMSISTLCCEVNFFHLNNEKDPCSSFAWFWGCLQKKTCRLLSFYMIPAIQPFTDTTLSFVFQFYNDIWELTPHENIHACLPPCVWIVFKLSRTDSNLKFKAKATNSCHQIQK